VFSKYAWAVPLRTKTGREVTAAFEQILCERRPAMVQSDAGSEFLNTNFQRMLSDNNIHFYTSQSDLKAVVVERFNRTLKERIYRYFTYKHTRRYIDVIKDIIHSYNNTHHRSIGMAPSEVEPKNEQIVRQRLYPLKPKNFKWKYNVGDTVRISTPGHVFTKGYTDRWSQELFTITYRHKTQPVTYNLKDMSNEPIKGRFYEFEIQKVNKPADNYYVVEKILKTRKRNGALQYFVKWQGYPESFNSWTDAIRNVV